MSYICWLHNENVDIIVVGIRFYLFQLFLYFKQSQEQQFSTTDNQSEDEVIIDI